MALSLVQSTACEEYVYMQGITAAELKKHIEQTKAFPIYDQRHERIGCLYLGPKDDEFAYNTEELNFIKILCNYVGLALENISQRQKLIAQQATLFKSEKLSALGQLAGGIAHEIRSPLTVIQANTDLLGEIVPPTEKTDKYIKRINENVEKVQDFIESMLDFCRTRPPEITKFDLGLLLKDCLQVIDSTARKQNIRIELDIGEVQVTSDRKRLQQVLVNICLNALQSMLGQPGVLSVSIKCLEQRVVIAVKDQGAGISEENRARLFQPLFTTKPQGTGLGLYMCKNIIESLNGKIYFESVIGQGTIFFVELPVLQ